MQHLISEAVYFKFKNTSSYIFFNVLYCFYMIHCFFLDDLSSISMFSYDVIDELMIINEITCKTLNRNISEFDVVSALFSLQHSPLGFHRIKHIPNWSLKFLQTIVVFDQL